MNAYIRVGLNWDSRLTDDPDEFPQIDIRDDHTLWLWLGPNVQVELDDEIIREMARAMEENKEDK